MVLIGWHAVAAATSAKQASVSSAEPVALGANRVGSSIVALNASAVIGPTPGTVINRGSHGEDIELGTADDKGEILEKAADTVLEIALDLDQQRPARQHRSQTLQEQIDRPVAALLALAFEFAVAHQTIEPRADLAIIGGSDQPRDRCAG